MIHFFNWKGQNCPKSIFLSFFLLAFIGLNFFTSCKNPAEPKDNPGNNGDAVVLFIFNANGGIFDDGGDLYIGQVINNRITPPAITHHFPVFTFKGWYTRAQGGELFNFNGPLTTSRTLYAQWEMVYFSGTSAVYDYLDGYQGGNMPGDPIMLPVNINLGDMTQGSNVWKALLEEIGRAGKYVNLDLSPCSMNGTVFNPDNTFSAGKGLVISLTLPQRAEEVQEGSWDNPPFTHFSSLASFSAEGLVSACDYFFTGFPNLSALDLPNLTSIGINAFAACTGLTSINFPSVKTVGNYAFFGCTGLQSISFPLAEEIGVDAFHGCTGLSSLNFPRVKIIDNGAFSNITRLQNINFPLAESIGEGVFWGCTNLRIANFPLAENIGNYAFSGCSELLEANFPLAKDIGIEAFIFCNKLGNVYIPLAENIGASAFYGCQNLSLVTLGVTPPALGDGAFLNTPMTGFTIKRPSASAAAYTQWLDDNSLKFYGGGSEVVFVD